MNLKTIAARDQEYTNLPINPSSFAPLRLCASQKNILAQRRKGAKFFRIKISGFGVKRDIGDYHIPNRWFGRLILLLSSFVICHSSFAQSASQELIPFQGRLTNQSGTAYTAGQYSIIFNLYSQGVGGSTLWTERHEKVGVVNGMVNVFLGSINPLTAVDFSTVKYLGITVDVDNNPATADPEMVPRQMIIPAFWAKRADNATKLAGQDWSVCFVNGTGAATNDPANGFVNGAKVAAGSIANAQLAGNAVTTANVTDGAVTSAKIADGTITVNDLSTALQQASVIPPGTIMPFAGNADRIPAGWLLCDGSALKSSNASYTAVYNAIQANWGNGITSPTGAAYPAIASGVDQTNFNIPDLRGQFLRGVAGTLSNDPDKATRTSIATGGAVGNAVGSVQVDGIRSHIHSYSSYSVGGSGGDIAWDAGGNAAKRSSPILNTNPSGGNETRPINAYVNYIIKL